MSSPENQAAGSDAQPVSPQALAVLLENHRKFLTFLERRVGSRDVAEDLLQDAFVRSIDKLASLRADESVVAWFYRVLRNAIVDRARHEDAERRALARASAEAEEADAVDTELMATVCACLGGLVGILRPEYAQALRRVDLDGTSVSAFSAEAGITLNNASVRLHRAREALRREVLRCCGTCSAHGCIDCSCKGMGLKAAHGGDLAHSEGQAAIAPPSGR